MPYIPPSVVQEVKRMDLLTYLKNYEPYELVHFSGNTYTTRTHDSLKISNGKWMWWSQRTGGRSALDYLIKVRGYSFLEAVELLAERANIQPPLSVSENVPMEKQLLLPKKNQDDQKVITYLSGRGIDKEIIQFCLESGRVYESAFHHNAVFVGMDEKDNPKYAAIRGTGTSFIGEANGSDKNYSFSIFTEGFYVLPSSVHEVLIVPDNGEMEPKMLGEMVREVNKNEVERQEVLSDRVYSYDKEKHQIRQEPDSIQKVKEMER